MKRKYALSPIGYAIVTIIIIAIGMIVSAPYIIEQNHSKEEPSEPQNNEINYKRDYNRDENMSNTDVMYEMERRINDRLETLERKQSDKKIISDKYVCSIEGGISEDGVVIPIDPQNPPAKFVFACEYKK